MKIHLGGHSPTVHETSWIAPNATVIGQVRLGERVGVWHNAVLRGDMDSANTLVPQGAEIPLGSLVAGVPGTVRRALTEAEQDSIRVNAAMYLDALQVHSVAHEG